MQINRSLLISVYLLHSKKKWNASSRGTPQGQFGLDTIFDLNKSLFKKEAEHQSCVNITFNFRGPYMKCFGTIFISFALFSNAHLNFNGVSRLRTEFSSLFHSLTEEGINDEFVEESLQKGTIRSYREL
jgi:hypothetical protein